jgi:hypothetical protein
LHEAIAEPAMTAQKLVMTITTLTGGTVGLFARIGVVKWLFRTDPKDARILTLFFFAVWCLLVVLGLLIGRRLGLLMTGESGSCRDRDLSPSVSRHALDRKHPDREDGAQRCQAADSPSGCVGDFVVAGAAHRVGFRGH